MTGTFSETEIAESLLAEMTPAVRGLVESLVVRNREQRLIIERLQSIIRINNLLQRRILHACLANEASYSNGEEHG